MELVLVLVRGQEQSQAMSSELLLAQALCRAQVKVRRELPQVRVLSQAKARVLASSLLWALGQAEEGQPLPDCHDLRAPRGRLSPLQGTAQVPEGH